MAGFKTHIGTSSLLGIGYGATGFLAYDIELPTCALAGGLCGIAGMLPDMDSPSSVPVRETVGFAAAVVPMLMLDHFRQRELGTEAIVVTGALVYLAIRFGLPVFLKHFSDHRGMWHSVPAAAIAGLVTFLICSCVSANMGLYKAGGVVLGYLSHLLLDELYALQWSWGRLRKKKSFGTALKLWGHSPWANISTYAKLCILLWFVVGDQRLPLRWRQPDHVERHQAELENAEVAMRRKIHRRFHLAPPTASAVMVTMRHGGTNESIFEE